AETFAVTVNAATIAEGTVTVDGGTSDTETVTINDIDQAINVTLAASETSINESSGTTSLTYTVNLDNTLNAGNTVSVVLSTGGTATDGTDFTQSLDAAIAAALPVTGVTYVAGTNTLTFDSTFVLGSFTFDLTANNDGIVEAAETFALTVGTASITEGTVTVDGGTSDTETVTVNDNIVTPPPTPTPTPTPTPPVVDLNLEQITGDSVDGIPETESESDGGTDGNRELSAEGAVIDAVSGAYSLGSVRALDEDGAVLDAVEGANSSTVYFGDAIDGELADNTGLWDISGVKGFSVSFSVSETRQGAGSESELSLFPLRVGTPEAESKDQLIVKSILRDRSLFLEVDYSINSDPNLLATSISVLQVNGSPLPDWLRVDDKGGLVSGEPPVGTEVIDLRIEVTLSDGTVIVRYIDVNVTSGEIAALQKIGEEFVAGASLFDKQIAQQAIKFEDSIDKIKNIFIN
ncbi:MAG: hypothetical protein ACI85N_000948, partial [Gammaproteobacteria bacterium]